jgi:glycosyltransferase involved in cell wall biosynthesis
LMNDDKKNLDLSVIVPVYNEEENIFPFYNELKAALEKLRKSHEIIFVNDGSTDETEKKIYELKKKDPCVKTIVFTKNFQKAAALSAGFDAARGGCILTMDGDLQDEPAEIPCFIKKMEEGYDVVVGWKHPRKDPYSRIIASRVFNFLLRGLTRSKLHDNDCNFRLIKKEVIKDIDIYSGLYRYIPLLASNKGYSVAEIKVKHNRRKFGCSKYGSERFFKGLMDLITIKFITSYYNRPMHFFGFIGSLMFLFGFAGGLYLLWLKLAHNTLIGSRPLLIFSVMLILLGVQFISIGLIGEMITSQSQRHEKKYVVKN